MQSKTHRPVIFSMRLSQPEEDAIAFLANAEGLPKSIYVRRLVRQTIKGEARQLPTEIRNNLSQLQVPA